LCSCAVASCSFGAAWMKVRATLRHRVELVWTGRAGSSALLVSAKQPPAVPITTRAADRSEWVDPLLHLSQVPAAKAGAGA
jgi:hypothetical protein